MKAYDITKLTPELKSYNVQYRNKIIYITLIHFSRWFVLVSSADRYQKLRSNTVHRRPCSDFMDMLQRLISCRIIIIIIIIIIVVDLLGVGKSVHLMNEKNC